MTRQEFINENVEKLFQSQNKNDAVKVAKTIIRSVDNLKYANNGNYLSNNDKQHIYKNIIEKSTSSKIIKEAQESSMFFRSIGATMAMLEPAVDELKSELKKLEDESKDDED